MGPHRLGIDFDKPIELPLLAVRYRVASNPEEKTLHHAQVFNVGCVIDNQVDPKSCNHPTADVETPQRTARWSERIIVPADQGHALIQSCA